MSGDDELTQLELMELAGMVETIDYSDVLDRLADRAEGGLGIDRELGKLDLPETVKAVDAPPRGKPARDDTTLRGVQSDAPRGPRVDAGRISVDTRGFAVGHAEASVAALARQTRAWRPDRRNFNNLARKAGLDAHGHRSEPALTHARIADAYLVGKGRLSAERVRVRCRFRAAFRHLLDDLEMRRMVAAWIVANGDEERIATVDRALKRSTSEHLA